MYGLATLTRGLLLRVRCELVLNIDVLRMRLAPFRNYAKLDEYTLSMFPKLRNCVQ